MGSDRSCLPFKMSQVGRPKKSNAWGVQCGTEKLDTWQLWETYILYMNYVSILVLRVYCRCGFLVSSRGETEFHVFFLCFVHLFRSFSKFVGSNELRFIYNTMIFKKDPRSMLLQDSKGTWPWKIMEYASFRSIWFNDFWFPCWTCVFPSHVCHFGNMIGFATGHINDFQLKAFWTSGWLMTIWSNNHWTRWPDIFSVSVRDSS